MTAMGVKSYCGQALKYKLSDPARHLLISRYLTNLRLHCKGKCGSVTTGFAFILSPAATILSGTYLLKNYADFCIGEEDLA